MLLIRISISTGGTVLQCMHDMSARQSELQYIRHGSYIFAQAAKEAGIHERARGGYMISIWRGMVRMIETAIANSYGGRIGIT